MSRFGEEESVCAMLCRQLAMNVAPTSSTRINAYRHCFIFQTSGENKSLIRFKRSKIDNYIWVDNH